MKIIIAFFIVIIALAATPAMATDYWQQRLEQQQRQHQQQRYQEQQQRYQQQQISLQQQQLDEQRRANQLQQQQNVYRGPNQIPNYMIKSPSVFDSFLDGYEQGKRSRR